MTTTTRAPASTEPARPTAVPSRSPFGFGAAMPPQKAKNFKSSARRLFARLAPERSRVIAVLAFAIAGVTLSVLGPLVMREATRAIIAGFFGQKFPATMSASEVIASLHASGHDRMADMLSQTDFVPGRGIDFARVGEILIGVLALYLAASLLSWIQGNLLNHIVQRTVRQMRSDVQAKLARLPLSYFDRQTHGEILSRATNDIDNVGTSLQQALSQVLGAVLNVLGALIMMLVVSRLLALIALVTVPISVLLTAKIARRSQRRFAAQWAHLGALNGQIEEAFTGHALIKVFGRRREIAQRFRAKNDELFEAGFRAQFLSNMIMPAVTLVANLTYVAIAVVGGLRSVAGKLALEDIQTAIQYSRQFSQQLGQLASTASVVQSGVASVERVFELLDAEEQVADPAAPAAPWTGSDRPRGEVRFEHVGFRYKPEQPLIEDLSLAVTPGQTVAIVGPTGAGKTTLVNLIMRFYELDRGRITIDGVDIARLARRDLRSQIGMVLQDTWLFAGTIRDNIRYGNPAASEADILAAARATYVDRFVRALPDGYDTVLDDQAGNLSAGEKQLITIARAFLADPAILILDEATSSVDTRTEVLVQHAMAALRARRTSFVIAHRLSTIRDANLILVMENGQIVEQGSHAELLAAHGAYHALYNAQFAAAAAA